MSFTSLRVSSDGYVTPQLNGLANIKMPGRGLSDPTATVWAMTFTAFALCIAAVLVPAAVVCLTVGMCKLEGADVQANILRIVTLSCTVKGRSKSRDGSNAGT